MELREAVKNVQENIDDLSKAEPVAIVLITNSYKDRYDADGVSIGVEYCFTLRQWREIYDFLNKIDTKKIKSAKG